MNFKRNFINLLVLFAVLTITACGGGGGDNGSGGGGTTGYSAGDMEAYAADGVTFKMSYVPGGLTFPTGVNDDCTATVANAYWIGETEVTYELWNKVYTWATNAARGVNQYHFANAGIQGDNGSRGIQHPVTTVNWRDCIVWCNALTEWYNAQHGTNYECVYTNSSAVIRDSRDANATVCDSVVVSSAAKGFRLLTSNEYELAARYRNGILWTYGDHASGDNSGACNDDGSILGGLGMSTLFGDYAIYSANSGSSTAVVKSKTSGSNAIGLFDLSGNVWEWCFDFGSSLHLIRGSSWLSSAYDLQVGRAGNYVYPGGVDSSLGFRFARTAP